MTDSFAAKAAQWDANPVRLAMHAAFLDEVLRTVPDLAGRTVLEFGCGTGILGLRLANEHGARLIFLDSSPAMLEILRGKLTAPGAPRAEVFEGDIAELPTPTPPADMVLALMCLHHVADIPGVLGHFARVLRPGGLVLAGDLMPDGGVFHTDGSALHDGFDPDALSGLFAARGLPVQALRVFHAMHKPDAAGTVREFPLFFLAARKA